MKAKLFMTLFAFACFSLYAQTTHEITWVMGISEQDASVTIETGDTVKWIWGEAMPHTVESNDPNAPAGFGSSIMDQPGDEYEFTFTEETVFTYICGLHPNMTGTITVTASGGGGFPAPYCAVTFNNGVEPITRVQVAGINNVTPPAVNGSPDHEDFTAIVGIMQQGESYPIALEGNTDGNYTNHFTVFIDWNQNGSLDDAGEVYQIGTIQNSNGTDGQQATGSITVPEGALLGTTRMRVFKNYNAYPLNSCTPTASFSWGQVEDYTIEVTAAPALCETATDLTLDEATDTTAMISWTASPTETEGYLWAVFEMGDDPEIDEPVVEGSVGTGVTTANISGLMPNMYYHFYMVTLCDNDIESEITGPLMFMTMEAIPDCEAPDVISIEEVEDTSATISWSESMTADAYYWMILPHEGDPETDDPITDDTVMAGVVSVTIQDLDPETTYDFYIASICASDDDVFSPLAGPFVFTTATLSRSGITANSTVLYPNPVKDMLNISAVKAIDSVEVFNIRGQKIEVFNTSQEHITIDLSHIPSGFYLLKINHDNESVSIQKIFKQ